MHRKLFIEGFAGSPTDFAQEVFLEADLGEVDPFAAGRPVEIARRDLRLGDKGDATIAEIGQADGIPGRLFGRLLAFQFELQIGAIAVTIDSIMNPVLGTPTGTGVGPTGGMATQTPSE